MVDIRSGITVKANAESEGSTFADAVMRASLSLAFLAMGVIDTSH